MLPILDAPCLLIWSVRYLVIISTKRSHQSKLIGGIHVVHERTKPAVPILVVMNDLAHGCLEAEIASISIQACVIGKTLSVATEVNLVVCLIEVAEARDEFASIFPLESGAWDNVKYPIGAVAVLSFVAAALHFEVVDVLGVKLRADVAGDIGVGYRHAIYKPTHLMSTTNMELVMSDIRPRNKVGDHR